MPSFHTPYRVTHVKITIAYCVGISAEEPDMSVTIRGSWNAAHQVAVVEFGIIQCQRARMKSPQARLIMTLVSLKDSSVR